MSSISEKLIRYDARFLALNPKLTTENIRFYLHIDLEVQNDYKPSAPAYPIIKRAVYYAAREISSQLGVLTGKSGYDRLEKVYSIWICNEKIPKELQNTVTSYRFTKQDIVGKTDEPEEDYDLMQVILIRRGNDEGKEEIFDYLTGVFSGSMERVARYVETERNPGLAEEVKAVSGMGMSIYEKGEAKGMQQGESNMSSLFSMLLSAGKLEEAKQASADPIYRAQLMREYRIIPQ